GPVPGGDLATDEPGRQTRRSRSNGTRRQHLESSRACVRRRRNGSGELASTAQQKQHPRESKTEIADRHLRPPLVARERPADASLYAPAHRNDRLTPPP